MKFVELIVQKLLNTDYENFTSFIITSIGIAESEPQFDPKDLKRLMWLRDNVHEDLKTSIYKLDRLIDPSKVSDDPTKYRYSVVVNSDKIYDKDNEEFKKINLRSEQLQSYLCYAIQEVNTIIYRNLRKYSEDFAMPTQSDEEVDNEL